MLFIVACGKGFSGQRDAALILFRGFQELKVDTHLIAMPTIDRGMDGGRVRSLLLYAGSNLSALVRTARLARRSTVIYMTPGQTRAAILRDSLFLCVAKMLTRGRCALALHGSLFMEWVEPGRIEKHFIRTLQKAAKVVVLSERQKQRLAALGVNESRLHVVDNAVEVEALGEEQIVAKHEDDNPIHVLYLSSLIRSKGYIEYLEALKQLSVAPNGPTISAMLCGPLYSSPLSEQGRSIADAHEHVVELMDQINKSERVAVTWNPVVTGAKKEAILRRAQIFVLPSRYRNEAQPLAIIEALASGCGVISSAVGEIPSSFGGAVVLLENPTSGVIAESIYRLAANRAERTELALSGVRLFQQRFSKNRYVSAWASILGIETTGSQSRTNRCSRP